MNSSSSLSEHEGPLASIIPKLNSTKISHSRQPSSENTVDKPSITLKAELLLDTAYDLGFSDSHANQKNNTQNLLERTTELASKLLLAHQNILSTVKSQKTEILSLKQENKLLQKWKLQSEKSKTGSAAKNITMEVIDPVVYEPVHVPINLADDTHFHALEKLKREYSEYKKNAGAKMARYELQVKQLKAQCLSEPNAKQAAKRRLEKDKSSVGEKGTFIESALEKTADFWQQGGSGLDGEVQGATGDIVRVQEHKMDQLLEENAKQNRYLCALFRRVFAEIEIRKYQEPHHVKLLKYI